VTDIAAIRSTARNLNALAFAPREVRLRVLKFGDAKPAEMTDCELWTCLPLLLFAELARKGPVPALLPCHRPLGPRHRIAHRVVR
jgi:hypothetical protein